jgi:hypothetical protein
MHGLLLPKTESTGIPVFSVELSGTISRETISQASGGLQQFPGQATFEHQHLATWPPTITMTPFDYTFLIDRSGSLTEAG